MDKYENLGTVGEGSYGVVLKCKDKTTGIIVAIKKFLESDNDKSVRKIATREIKILKSLRHENLINLIEVFRRNKRIYLVFEYIEQNLLEEIEKSTNGLGENKTREIMYQVVRGIDFMHSNNVIHRDLKPENVLIDKNGLVKLCDFGFARQIAQPSETYTDYVATRWYRSPELLVGDPKYGKPVDIWSIGVLTYEVLTSKPLYPGESDLDQLYLIMSSLGDLPESMKLCFQNNQFYANVKLPRIKHFVPLQNKLKKYSSDLISFILESLIIDPHKRYTSSELLQHDFFTTNSWIDGYLVKLRELVNLHENSITNRSTSIQSKFFSTNIPPNKLFLNNKYQQQNDNQQQQQQQQQQLQPQQSKTSTSPFPNTVNETINLINENNNQKHQNQTMNKVNITFSNYNSDSKASFISMPANTDIYKNKQNKILYENLQSIKQTNKEDRGSPDTITARNSNLKYFPKLERQATESPKIEIQPIGSKIVNGTMNTNGGMGGGGGGLVNYSSLINNSNNSTSNIYKQLINSNSNVNNTTISNNSNNNINNNNNNKLTNANLANTKKQTNINNNSIDFSLVNSSGVGVGGESFLTNSNITFNLNNNNNNQPDFNSNSVINTNNNINSNQLNNNVNRNYTNQKGANNYSNNGQQQYVYFDENFKINNNSNNNSNSKKQASYNYQRSNHESNSKTTLIKDDKLQLNGINNASNPNFRLPHVKQMDLYTKSKNSNLLYENKKQPFLMQVNKKP